MPTRRRFLALAFLAAVAGCSRNRTPRVEDDSDTFVLTVFNHHRLDVTIYNVAQGRRERLGEVTAAADKSFTLHVRRLVNNEIQLFADAIGSTETVRSDNMHVAPGDALEWTLETQLNRSMLIRR